MLKLFKYLLYFTDVQFDQPILESLEFSDFYKYNNNYNIFGDKKKLYDDDTMISLICYRDCY